MHPFDLRNAPSTDLIDLRHRVLRQGLPRDSAKFEGDDEPTTLHSIAVAGDQTVGCATMVRRPLLDDPTPAYQLRGMAVDADWQKRGVGAAVLDHLEARARAAGIGLLWCNARLIAIPFYERKGWRIISERFEIPSAGPHHRMRKDL